MRKRASILVSLLLAVLLLSGCALPFFPRHEEYLGPQEQLVSFDEIKYERPDIGAFEDKARELFEALEKPFAFREIVRLLEEYYAMYNDFQTMYNVAYIRYCQNVLDESYAREYEWLELKSPDLDLLTHSVYSVCADSRHAGWLERFVLWDGFVEEYGGLAELDEELVARVTELYNHELALLGEYRDLLARPTIDIGELEHDYYEYIMIAPEQAQAAAHMAYYEKYNALLGDIYIRLLKVRNELAELLDYEDYAAMEYESYTRDYSPEQALEYMELIKRYIAPLGRELAESGAYYELEYEPVSADELVSLLKTAAEGLGGSIDDAFQIMQEFELYDFELDYNKADMSFTSYLPSYEVPYLFLMPYGDTEDIITVFHEFGHYADSYIRYNAYENIDLSESFSQTMQFLCLDQIKGELSEKQFDMLRRMNLMDILNSFLQQAALAEFELRACRMEQPSVEKLNELCLELCKEYGFYEEYGLNIYPYIWTDTPHLFESPMYVISYPVAAAAAIEIYQLEREEKGAGTAKFIEMSESGLAQLGETLEYAGMENSMSEAGVKKAADFLRSQFMNKSPVSLHNSQGFSQFYSLIISI